MPDDPRVQELLDELFERQITPEEVCNSCVELLPVVRERWRQICQARAELDALLPTGLDGGSPPLPPEGPLPLPTIPGYEVEAVLGTGGMGVVFRARHLRLNRIVALKMALAGAYAGPHERERFQREAEAVAVLRHPNVVQIHDVGDADGRPYFTMEYVDGGSLAQKLAGKPQPARESAALVATLAAAIQAAHESGVVHRDLKPANVLLTADGTPKVSDFGLARRLGGEAGLTHSGAAVGTPSYMAPEQARGQAAAVGPAADVYALGAILYELLTGRPPFRAETAVETVVQVIYQDPVPPSQLNATVPRDLETVCLKCLHKEPERRYVSAAALAEDLRRYLLGQVIAARPVGPLERAGKWIRRNRAVASLAAAAVVTLLAGTVVSLLFAWEARRQEGLATDRAGDLERQAIALKAQTRAATENAQRAREKEEEVRRVLIASLLIPIEANAHPLKSRLDNTEVIVLCQLRKLPREVRLQFLETALRDPEAARRVGRRADWVIQSIVGADRSLRDEVGQLLVRHNQNPATTPEVMLAGAQLGHAANLDNRVWVERAAEVLSAALCDEGLERDDCIPLAESFAAVIDHLPRAQAAEHSARVTDVFRTRLQEPSGMLVYYAQFGPVIEVVSPHLDPVAANRAAETIGAILHNPKSHPGAWEVLAKAQVAVCKRLPPPDAAAHVTRTVEVVFKARGATKESDKSHYVLHAKTLGALAEQFDATIASRAADAIIATLGDSYMTGNLRSEFIDHSSLAEDLARVAERLNASGSLRAAEGLIPVLIKADKVVSVEALRKALVGVCRRLDADGAGRVAEATGLAIRDPKTPDQVRVLLAHGWAAAADKLGPDQEAPLEKAVVEVLIEILADATLPLARWQLPQALAAVCGRPNTRSAPRAAEALTAAIRDPQTPPGFLRPLAAALAAVSGPLPPAQGSAQTSKAAEALGSLWVARTSRLDRASLARATAELWTRLSRPEVAAHARRMADDLGDALQDAKTEPLELIALAQAFTAVCSPLDPAEAQARLDRAEKTLVVRFRNPKTSAVASAALTEALGALWLGFDRKALARVTDTFCMALSDSDVPRHKFELHVTLFKKVAGRLDERDLERLLDQPLTGSTIQRAVLDVLGESKNRSFRNTWDYLDWIRSKDNWKGEFSKR
jgi:hypothetical protein